MGSSEETFEDFSHATHQMCQGGRRLLVESALQVTRETLKQDLAANWVAQGHAPPPRTVPAKIQDLLKGRPNTCCSSWIRVKVWEGERREEEGPGKEGFIVGRKKTEGFSEPCQNSSQPHHLAKEIVSVAERTLGMTPKLCL